MDELKNIRTRNELADYLGIPRNKLTYVLYVKKTESFYKTFDIPKKSGGFRHIHAPAEDLKWIQKRLAVVLYNYEKHIAEIEGTKLNISHAFEKKKSFITNAEIHRNKRFVINVDLENFFDSFHFGRVRGYFMKNKNYQLPKEVATTIAQIVCYEGKLPQGAPSSPIITNMICNIFDMRLLHLAKKYKLDYTRYADDLSFSTNNKKFIECEEKFFGELASEVTRAGFAINSKKTRVQYKDSHQEVTGIVVNKKLNVDKKYYKMTRAMAHELYKNGEYTIDGKVSETINQLEGRFSYINQLDKYNSKLKQGKHQYEYLNGRERTYSQFLFYKYFFDNEKPLIITEGKTDIKYLKAALKQMSEEYSKFIHKADEHQFEYKINFLRRSERLELFLNIKVDGADTLNNIVEFYKKGRNPRYPNYMEYFKELGKRKPTNPVILVFDNELMDEKKPASKFAKRWLNEDQKKALKEDNWVHIQDNLYMMVTPLVEGSEQTDIEMLFDEDIQNIEIDGRILDKTGTKNKNEYFNKDIFSQYIMKNYDKINFVRFKPIFENLDKIITLYQSEK